MNHFEVDILKKWEYENGFYLTCDTGRIGKFLNHLELYKFILDVPGDVLEFGVFKGASLVRLLTFRDLLENSNCRKVYGFDVFGKFPRDLKLETDQIFVEKFENEGGIGIKKDNLDDLLQKKGFKNYDLIEGNILETLDLFLTKNPNIEISLLHIDVDVYEPTKVILDNLWSHVVKFGVVMFDDYQIVEGASKAINEFVQDKNVVLKKLPYYKAPWYVIKQ